MKKILYPITSFMIILGMVIFAAVCWHSVEEIHYLKSFFPKRFNAQEAYYASAIELVKVVIIGMPIVLFVVVSLYMLRHLDKEQE